MPSVYCTQCGHANPEDARFCSRCGSPLSVPVPAAADTTSTISLEALEAEAGQTLLPDRSAVERLPPGTALLVVMRGPNAGIVFCSTATSLRRVATRKATFSWTM